MTRGNETGVPEAETVEALYDAFAQPLFWYAWSLLGDPDQYTDDGDRPDEDPVTDAVHEAFVAGIGLESRLTDPADRGPWLFALVRTACQQRGFAPTCPYTRLATVPDEAPVARMFSRLPASHRELVELNLRHALSTSAVSRVLGLEPRICGELSRSAIRRAAEGLEELPAPEPDEDTPSGTWRTQVHQVSSALALLRPRAPRPVCATGSCTPVPHPTPPRSDPGSPRRCSRSPRTATRSTARARWARRWSRTPRRSGPSRSRSPCPAPRPADHRRPPRTRRRALPAALARPRPARRGHRHRAPTLAAARDLGPGHRGGGGGAVVVGQFGGRPHHRDRLRPGPAGAASGPVRGGGGLHRL
ncbi:sigma-70 family RNA polymerase sigma factor [Nocardiopsis eucommiae]|uniref:Sigma-70 family RNA polymerase sigma factor n=1 Tax=Nocardiopsis eucommiae TaxID=2831970 RepID=A0A975QJV9_9ACTN|nr:sigma-70 family RNA polymerase sigma factor [Nocardiopsis eucommiae]